MLGRVSLNPLVHIDPIGTILLPLVAMVSGLPIIGWAKPVPVNVSRLRNPQRDFAIIAAAGPISNLLQALAVGIVLHLVWPDPGAAPAAYDSIFLNVLYAAAQINVLLALFNLIPVPPLDGGNVLAGLLPPAAASVFIAMRPFGFLILYAMMFTGMLSAIIMPPARFLERLLLP
jgi:Zn-dependent protease